MKLGMELVARHPLPLSLGTFFETWIATAAGSARRSLGRDEYHLRIHVDTGARLAATGRTHVCQVDLEAAGLGRNGARPALLTPVDVPDGSPVIWGIRTNRFLDVADLIASAGARLLREGSEPAPFALDDPRVRLECVAPGRYIVDITRLLAD
ncbi:MAG: hypothetical protein A6D92_08365 [Symbiobacterium thermophilum]|uniref:Uncharacterized protein n=2 Tax=Symbiobacterium thermophilum TaxID=2734 RepID=Q67NH4_SYMTH|nr:hypothetical protein [Symbiobacterium thermophilum]OTA41259.1 MAG: hypothetical protein A6D92_08365 [Symbiobacterium thermophilum]BAD40769.1 hypothetical protein STH1784 [Symbiobacterium thermophilum IAM 14863]